MYCIKTQWHAHCEAFPVPDCDTSIANRHVGPAPVAMPGTTRHIVDALAVQQGVHDASKSRRSWSVVVARCFNGLVIGYANTPEGDMPRIVRQLAGCLAQCR